MPSEALALLQEARARYSQSEVAGRLNVSVRTVRRWEARETDPPPYLGDAIRQRILPLATESAPVDDSLTCADLFAGIGGIRLGFQKHGVRCVFTSEWNSFAQRTYIENFPDSNHTMAGDITQVDADDVPNHDLLLAGFPCQPFSIAGVSKKNALGRPHGFECATQGTLFFEVARLIAAKKPAAFLLENVKNLVSHDGGKTFRIIMRTLKEDLGYHVSYRVVDARHFVPQHRERILIAGFREPTDFTWDELRLPETHPTMSSVLHPETGPEVAERRWVSEDGTVSPKYTLSKKLWDYLRAYAKKHRAAGNGFGFGLVGPGDVARTLSARYFKDGSEILVSQGPRRSPRRLTPRECARLMGYPDSFKIPVSDTQAYRQFGNSVVVPVIEEVARIMVPHVLQVRDRTKYVQTARSQK